MKKEDYMHLPKERLAEMLAERDAEFPRMIYVPTVQLLDMCPISGGYCSNPFHDCINCPRHAITYQTTSSGGSGAELKDQV